MIYYVLKFGFSQHYSYRTSYWRSYCQGLCIGKKDVSSYLSAFTSQYLSDLSEKVIHHKWLLNEDYPFRKNVVVCDDVFESPSPVPLPSHFVIKKVKKDAAAFLCPCTIRGVAYYKGNVITRQGAYVFCAIGFIYGRIICCKMMY